MSKQLSGSLFVDIQGDNKNFKKSIDQSEKQVQAFSNTLTQTLGNNLVFDALLGAGGIFGGMKAFKQFRAFKAMKRSSLGDDGINLLRRQTNKDALFNLKNYPMEFEGTRSQYNEDMVTRREAIRSGRPEAARAKLRQRGGIGLLGHRGGATTRMMQKLGAGKDMAQFAARGMATFMASGAGLAILGGAVAALGAYGMKQMFDRGKEAQSLNPDKYKQDALTQIARIKQNIAIARGTQLEGYAGGGARFRQRQSANAAAGYATAGNVAAGTWDYAVGILNWFMAGGLPGAIGRVTIGGGSFI